MLPAPGQGMRRSKSTLVMFALCHAATFQVDTHTWACLPIGDGTRASGRQYELCYLDRSRIPICLLC